MSKPQLELVPVNEALVNEVADSYVIREWNEMLNANFQASDWSFGNRILSDAFSWQKSKEGHAFWSVINRLFTIKTVKPEISCGEIYGYKVTVLGDGTVRVGCTTVPQSQVDDIIAAIAKQKEGE
jgi:hypothetical protein